MLEEREELTEAQKQKRLEFAESRMDYDWKNVLFTDEKSFWLGSGEQKGWQDPRNRRTRKKRRFPPKLHAWGGVGHYFKTRLYFFTQHLDAELHCQILNARLPPEYAVDCPPHNRGNWIIQQDNDPKHTARKTTKLLNEIAPDRLQDHPPNSPDFNIMEDVWSHLDREMKKKKIKSISHLRQALTKAWEDMSWSFVRKSVASIPDRLQICIANGGERTTY